MDDIRGNFRHALIPLAVTAAFGSASAHAEEFDDRWYFAPMGSYVLADDERSTDDGWGGVLAIGKRLSPRLELELRGQYLKYETDEEQQCLLLPLPILCTDPPQDTEITSGGVGASYFFSPSGRGLFAHADALFGDATLYNIGLGFDIGQEVALRVEALYHIDDDASVEETQFNVGLRIPIGQRPAAEAPEPVRVVEPVAPPPKALCADGIDNDGDGAIDYPSDPGCTSAIDDDETNPRCETPAAGQPVDLDGCAVGDSIVLNGVNFEFDKATLTANAKTLLDQVADALQRRGDIKVEVAGHTDSKGSDAYNQALSEARAESVVEYLSGRGIDPVRMTPRGYGESMPVADNESDAGRELNRRVELKVLESSRPLQTSSASTMATPAPVTAPAPALAYTDSTVVMENYTFMPGTVVVAPGTTVTWNNIDTGHAHIVAFADGESDRIAAGGSYSRRFDAPGEYAYECGLHPSMRGAVVVR